MIILLVNATLLLSGYNNDQISSKTKQALEGYVPVHRQWNRGRPQKRRLDGIKQDCKMLNMTARGSKTSPSQGEDTFKGADVVGDGPP